MDWLPQLLATALAVVLAITLHEAAHGYAAQSLGDPTAAEMGRLSLNPLRHVDTVGTLIVPGLLILSQLAVTGRVDMMFGWAKPVPVDPSRLRNPRFGMVAVAAAGPAVNFLLAFASALGLHLAMNGDTALHEWVFHFLTFSILGNLILAFFNLLPVPPLDGGRILGGLLPPAIGVPFLRLERFGLLIVLALIFLLPNLVSGADPMRWLVGRAVMPTVGFLLRAAGIEF